jgi:hypothetical protein
VTEEQAETDGEFEFVLECVAERVTLLDEEELRDTVSDDDSDGVNEGEPVEEEDPE